jgi:ribosomal protein L40E
VSNLSPFERRKLLKSQTGRLQETLAEMSSIEAEEALERSDRSGAITSLKEAIKYFPENINYYIKLSEILAIDSISEAVATLDKALEYSPNNEEIKERINKLKQPNKSINSSVKQLTQEKKQKGVITLPPSIYKTPKKEPEPKFPDFSETIQLQSSSELTVPKRITQELVSPPLPIEAPIYSEKINKRTQEIVLLPAEDSVPKISNEKKLLCPKCNLVNSIKSNKCERCNTRLTRFNKIKTQAQQKAIALSNRIKTQNIIILTVIVFAILISIPLAYKDTVIMINPLSPNEKGILYKNNPSFQWDVSAENVLFLLTIQDSKNNKVIERLTDQFIYTLSYEEAETLKTGEVYKWKVIPLSPKRVPLKYKSKELNFILSSNLKENSQQ